MDVRVKAPSAAIRPMAAFKNGPAVWPLSAMCQMCSTGGWRRGCHWRRLRGISRPWVLHLAGHCHAFAPAASTLRASTTASRTLASSWPSGLNLPPNFLAMLKAPQASRTPRQTSARSTAGKIWSWRFWARRPPLVWNCRNQSHQPCTVKQ